MIPMTDPVKDETIAVNSATPARPFWAIG